jgi:pre-mRNA-processing factor 19
MATTCALSGTTPVQPVVSIKSGHVFEKRLIEKYLEANGNVCPVTNQELKKEDLIEIKVNKVVPPRPTTATSIPAMLSLFQNEWDAVMLETYSLKQQLDSVRQELAHALYQHDAACRVIARLIKERDEAKALASNLRANGASASSEQAQSSDSMEVESGLKEEVKNRMFATSQELAKDRKKRKPSESLASAEDIKSYEAIMSTPLHSTTSPGVNCVDIHPTKQHILLTGGNDGGVIVFNRDNKKILSTQSEHTKKVTDVLFHSTQDMFFSCSVDKTAKLWAKGDGAYKSVHTVKHHGEVVGCILQATGSYWITASADKTWAFHDIETTSTLVSVNGDAPFTSVSFHPDGLIVGTGSADSAVKIWDVKALKNAATFEGHKGKVVDITFSENGYYLATAAEDSTVKLWDLRKLKQVHSIQLPEDFSLSSLDFDYSGTYLAVSGSDVRVFIGKTMSHIATYNHATKRSERVNDVRWGGDAEFLASVGSDRQVKIWSKK